MPTRIVQSKQNARLKELRKALAHPGRNERGLAGIEGPNLVEEAIRAGLVRTAEFAVNPDPERGQLSSLQCGFHALDKDHGAVFFTPVDYPGIRPETVEEIHSAMKPGDAAVVPAYRGRHGHPVLIAPQLV